MYTANHKSKTKRRLFDSSLERTRMGGAYSSLKLIYCAIVVCNEFLHSGAQLRTSWGNTFEEEVVIKNLNSGQKIK